MFYHCTLIEIKPKLRVVDNNLTLDRLQVAESEWLAHVSRQTEAHGYMVDSSALCVLTTHPRTRVCALAAHAGFVRRTVWADCALRSASLVRVAEEVGQAGTSPRTVLLTAHSVAAARRRGAGCNTLCDYRRC